MFTPEKILLTLFAIMFAVGAADYLCNSPLKLGKRFVDGLQTFAPLFLTMAGFIIIAPLLAKVLTPASSLFSAIGADPGVFPGFFLANDNGAYPLAQKVAIAPEGAGFGGILVGGVIGVNVIYMPLVMQIMTKEDRPFYFKGLMYGIITAPAGLLAGALAANYSWGFILRQMPPLLAVSGAAALMLWLIPETLVKILSVFAKFMEILAMAGCAAAVFMEFSGVRIPDLVPLGEAVKIIGAIVVLLSGVYVFMEILTRIFRKFLLAAGKRFAVNETSVMGIITTSANSIPTLAMIKDMDPKGKMINCTFMASGAFMLGDHLAYCGAVVPQLLFPMILTKLTAAVLAVLLVCFCCRKEWQKESEGAAGN